MTDPVESPPSPDLPQDPGVAEVPRSRIRLMVLTIAALGACGLLVSLGNWQVRRLAEKTALTVHVAERIGQPPQPLPPPILWPAIDPIASDYTPVTVTGQFRHDHEFHVFANLAAPRGSEGGVGWWIFTPLVEADGTTVIINRGFVPDRLKQPSTRTAGQIEGVVTLSGLLRRPEGSNIFTPGNHPDTNQWFTRDPLAMARDLGLKPDAILPFYIDAGKEATPPGGLPQAGETVIEFPNNHLGYAITWYGLALACVGVYGVFVARWLRARRGGSDAAVGNPSTG